MSIIYETAKAVPRRVKCPECGTKFKGQPNESCPEWRRHLKSANDPGWSGPADYVTFFDIRLDDEDGNEIPFEDLEGAVGKKTGGHSKVLEKAIQRDAKARAARRSDWRARRLYIFGRATVKQMAAYKLHIEGGMSHAEVAQKLGIGTKAARARIEAAKVHEDRARKQEVIKSRS
jgi:hypothetical protein